MRGLRTALVALVVALLGAGGAGSAPTGAGGDALPRVTLIGDSAATAIGQFVQAQRILARGVDLRLELAPCRRVDRESCPHDGARPPTVIELVRTRGAALGPTVIVSVGYNDDEDAYAQDVETALAALRRAGVEHVLWTTLRAVRHPYLTMNDAIQGAAARHPELTVVDWNRYSRSHPDWFQPDGLHLGYDGAIAMATLFRSALVELGIPRAPARSAVRPLAVVTARLPAAVSGRPYAALLKAHGGRPPYRWTSTAPFPPWLRLTREGRLAGTVGAAPGLLTVSVRVSDAAGRSTGRRLRLRVGT